MRYASILLGLLALPSFAEAQQAGCTPAVETACQQKMPSPLVMCTAKNRTVETCASVQKWTPNQDGAIVIEYYYDSSLSNILNPQVAFIQGAIEEAIATWNLFLETATEARVQFHFNDAIFPPGVCPANGFNGIVFRYNLHDFGSEDCSQSLTYATQDSCGCSQSVAGTLNGLTNICSNPPYLACNVGGIPPIRWTV